MSKYLFILLLVAFGCDFAYAQDTPADDQIYDARALESKPEFPGGLQDFYKYIGNSYVVPDSLGMKSGIVFIKFVIEKDGSTSEVKAIRDIGFGTGKEAERVIRKSPKWIPAQQNGKPVRVLYTLPIKIVPPEPETKPVKK